MKFRISHLLLIFIFLLQNCLGTVLAAQMQFQQSGTAFSGSVVAVEDTEKKMPCPHHATHPESQVGSVTGTEGASDDHCDFADCSKCQCVANLNLIFASPVLLLAFIPFQNSLDNPTQALTDLPPHLILRPPKS